MNERIKVVNLCSGRMWWVKYVTGNRKMTEGVLREGKKNPKWDVERTYDPAREQDHEHVVRWLLKDVETDVEGLKCFSSRRVIIRIATHPSHRP